MFEHGDIDLSSVKYFVIDEADEMLDHGFGPDVKELASKMPEARVTMMFSATFPETVQDLAKEVLKKKYTFATIGVVGSVNVQVKQEILEVIQIVQIII